MHESIYVYVSQDRLFMLGPEITLNFSSVWQENPSLLNPYDIISDVINDITTTPKIYISWGILFHDIQHGYVSKSMHQFASGLYADPQVNISAL